MPEPPAARLPSNPWPQWPEVKKTDYGQEEAIALMGGEMRAWGVDTLSFETDEEGRVRALTVVDLDWSGGAPERIPGTERSIPAQLVLIACGFTGPETELLHTWGVALPEPGAGRPLPVMEAPGSHRCALEAAVPAPTGGIWACGDARSGATLVVSAIADALACAQELAAELGLA